MNILPDPTPPPRPDYSVMAGMLQVTAQLSNQVVSVRSGTPLIADAQVGWRVAKAHEDWDLLASSGGSGGDRVNCFKALTLRADRALFQTGQRYGFADIDHTGMPIFKLDPAGRFVALSDLELLLS